MAFTSYIGAILCLYFTVHIGMEVCRPVITMGYLRYCKRLSLITVIVLPKCCPFTHVLIGKLKENKKYILWCSVKTFFSYNSMCQSQSLPVAFRKLRKRLCSRAAD